MVKNLDWRKEDLSGLKGALVAWEEGSRSAAAPLSAALEVLMRKKFFSFWGKWLLPLVALVEGIVWVLGWGS